MLWIDPQRLQYQLEAMPIQGVDRNTLQLGTFARFDRDVAFGSAERCCDDFD